MGGAVSAGKDNDDLIDKLADGNHIKSVGVERMFRAVDRGHYFLPDFMEQAYRDTAWRAGNIHMSAPCIYSEVLEALELRPGLSFLNLGSGTGYLSTMVGLALGPYAISHGIELHSDVVEYARSRLATFILNSEAFDEFDDLCQPSFVVGNCLLCSPRLRYDRIYCGAACPEPLLRQLKDLLKPGGILVVPVHDQLLQCRLSEDGETLLRKVCMPVSFAGLVLPQLANVANGDTNGGDENLDSPFVGSPANVSPTVSDQVPVLPDSLPPTLQQACRFIIRRHIRGLITSEHPGLLKWRLFDREAAKSKRHAQEGHEEDVGGESGGDVVERTRPARTRTRYLSIGNNFGVVIISENGSSSEEEDVEENADEDGAVGETLLNEHGATIANRDTEGIEEQGPIAGENESLDPENELLAEDRTGRNRTHIPPFLRLFFNSRRVAPAQQEADALPAANTEGAVEAEEASPNHSRRRRRGSSAASAADDVKKQKEDSMGTDSSSSPCNTPCESTGRRLSRLLHERIRALQLPSSIEAFLLYYRASPPPVSVPLHAESHLISS